MAPPAEGGDDEVPGPPPFTLGPNAAYVGYLTPEGGLSVSREALDGNGMSMDVNVRGIFGRMLGSNCSCGAAIAMRLKAARTPRDDS